jgi:mono/diheme cytochrome c family protein
MAYPFWDVGIGYGVLMATIAVIHVFISHFAIGGGLYLVVAETAARRVGDSIRLAFLERLSRFFVLVSVVLGALTGVGIWFIIGLLNPAATEALIHNFVWGWAIEWTFFLLEITAAIIYYHGWKRMSARDHLFVGWVYFVAAWLSLFVINGIIDFMLTPGQWLQTGNFWDGFFNPTYWPSLFFRTGICLFLAGLYALLVASMTRQKSGLIRYNTVWAVVGLVVMIPTFYWYWKAIPADIVATALESMRTPILSIELSFWFAGAIGVLLLVFGFALPRAYHPVVAVVVMALGLGYFGSFEWMRESIRKPYVIYGYMFGNAVELAKEDTYRKDGYLSQIAFRTGDDGADLFRHACRTCHTIDGYKPLKPTFDGTDPGFIAGIIKGADTIKGNMPPFLGTDEEVALISDYVWKQVDQRPFGDVYGLSGRELGAKVFEVRCGRCHEFGGFRDIFDSVTGLTEDEYNDIFDNGSDYGDGMPDFTGTETERKALIAYLQSLEKGGGSR